MPFLLRRAEGGVESLARRNPPARGRIHRHVLVGPAVVKAESAAMDSRRLAPLRGVDVGNNHVLEARHNGAMGVGVLVVDMAVPVFIVGLVEDENIPRLDVRRVGPARPFLFQVNPQILGAVVVQVAVLAEEPVHFRRVVAGQHEVGAVDLPVRAGLEEVLRVVNGFLRGCLDAGVSDLITHWRATCRPKTNQ